MKKNFSYLLFLFLQINFFSLVSAQCPTILITGSASPSVFCTGTSSQLAAFAQVGSGGYLVMPITYGPVAGSGTAVALADDQLSSPLPIGFNFTFFGNSYNQFYICSNGYLSFSYTGAVYFPSPVPSTNMPDNFISGFHYDLNPGVGGTIGYFTAGVAPYRQLIVNFNSVPMYSTGSPVTMQFILYETTNAIDIHITTQLNNVYSLEGIENASGSLGLTVPGRNVNLWTTTNDAWRFAPGDTVLTYNWSPSIGLSDTTISNPVANPTTSTQYIVTATDSNGCTGTDTVDLIVVSPVTSITATPQTVCEGDTVHLNVSAIVASTMDYTVDTIPFAPSSGTGVNVVLGDDQVSNMFPIGFLFSFYGTYYNDFAIGSNGFITFDINASTNNYQGCCAGQLLPTTAVPNNLIAAAWEDLDPTSAGTIKYFNTGTFPFEKLVVQFTNVPHAPLRDSVTFEIVLFETTNIIEIHTTSMPGNPHGFWYAHTQGIEDIGGTRALSVPGRNCNNSWTATNEAVRFSPYGTLNYSWTPPGSLSDPSIYNPVALPANTIYYSVTVTDSAGCTGTDSILINVNPIPPVPVITFSSGQLHSSYSSGNQWYFQGGIINGAVLADYTPLLTGMYAVVYTDASGCTSVSDSVLISVGIDEVNQENNFAVYPNPVGTTLNITSGKYGEYTFLLFDITSRKILQKDFSDATILNTGDLASGVYSYQIKNNSGVVKIGRIEKN
jgi:hypothetical protein